MDTENRRYQILKLLENQHKPVSGTVLSKLFGVSRQVVVQDIALLRAENKEIISTNKGYVLIKAGNDSENEKRVFRVKHDLENMQEELNCIVDNGGYVLDVLVDHDLYGQISGQLQLHNRADVAEFINKVKVSKSKPLKVLTDDIHYHTVEAKSVEILDRIERKLDELGMLVKE